jgi:hypothetical protein
VKSTDFAPLHPIISSQPNIHPRTFFFFPNILTSKQERTTAAGCIQLYIHNNEFQIKADNIFKTITTYKGNWVGQVNSVVEP